MCNWSPRSRKNKNREDVFEQIIVTTSLKLIKDKKCYKITMDEELLSKISIQKNKPRHILIKLLKIKETTLKIAKIKKQILYTEEKR